MSTENNGYLDSDQTIVNYGIRELGCSFQQLLRDDPSRMLRNWRKCRKSAQTTAIGTTVLGAGAVCAGVFTGALPVLIAGVAVAAGSGLLVRHHAAGAEACELEATILDECRPILTLLAELERRGANPSDLVSVYDRLVRAALANQLQPTDQAALKEFFNRELEASQVFANLSGVKTGLSVPARRDDADRPSEWELPAAAEPQDAAASFSPTGETVEGEPIAPPPELQSGPVSSAAPDLASITTPKQRMAALLNAMAEAGFPLGKLLNHPFVWCWGRSQSGKTSIALLLAMARLAMGHRVGYLTTDDDYPRELPWSRVEDSPEGYAVALDEVAETISSATKGGLAGQGWIFDELFAASATHNIKIQPLLTTVLMKGAKTKAGVIGISQADTSSAHGLKGIDAAWREERVSVQAIHQEDSQGDRRPTGCYIIRQGDEQQEWQLPPWMLSERNQRGDIDPVVWMLRQFPELVSRPTATPAPAPTPAPTPSPAPQPQDDRARLEQLFRAESAEPSAPSTGSSPTTEPLEKLSRYLQSKGKIDFRTLDKNWGRNNGFQGEALKNLLTQLESQGSIVTWGDGIIWKG